MSARAAIAWGVIVSGLLVNGAQAGDKDCVVWTNERLTNICDSEVIATLKISTLHPAQRNWNYDMPETRETIHEYRIKPKESTGRIGGFIMEIVRVVEVSKPKNSDGSKNLVRKNKDGSVNVYLGVK
jgi:hypothetical protein